MEENKELVFKEDLEGLLESFGQESQEGVKQALRNCQELFACVSKAHQDQIARAFGLDGKIVATLMKFNPRLKESIVEYEVTCCTGARCAKNGSLEVLRAVRDVLGIDFDQVTEDGRIRLTSQNCFKKCGLGPNIMVNGSFYHQMNRERARELMTDLKNK